MLSALKIWLAMYCLLVMSLTGRKGCSSNASATGDSFHTPLPRLRTWSDKAAAARAGVNLLTPVSATAHARKRRPLRQPRRRAGESHRPATLGPNEQPAAEFALEPADPLTNVAAPMRSSRAAPPSVRSTASANHCRSRVRSPVGRQAQDGGTLASTPAKHRWCRTAACFAEPRGRSGMPNCLAQCATLTGVMPIIRPISGRVRQAGHVLLKKAKAA